MRCVRVQSPAPLLIDLHVHHPGLYKVRCIGAGGNHTGSLCRSGRHGDRVHTDVQEPWRPSRTYSLGWHRYRLPAGAIPALLLWREDQRRQQEDRHGVKALKMTLS